MCTFNAHPPHLSSTTALQMSFNFFCVFLPLSACGRYASAAAYHCAIRPPCDERNITALRRERSHHNICPISNEHTPLLSVPDLLHHCSEGRYHRKKIRYIKYRVHASPLYNYLYCSHKYSSHGNSCDPAFLHNINTGNFHPPVLSVSNRSHFLQV